MFSLKRIKPDDGAGMSRGWVCTNVKFSDNRDEEYEREATRPKEGWALYMDNPSHWYHTSTVTEIISEEDNEDRVKITFTTQNSTYEFRRLK